VNSFIKNPAHNWFPETFYLREIFPPRLKDMTGKKIIHFSFFICIFLLKVDLLFDSDCVICFFQSYYKIRK
jgi:hypothetical protein